MPTYIPTSCLSASYEQAFSGQVVETFVPARGIHQALYDDETTYRRFYEMYAPRASDRSKMQKNCNIITAQLTLLYSEVDPDEGMPARFETYALPVTYAVDSDHISFGMKNLYTAQREDINTSGQYMCREDFNAQIFNRLALAKLVVPLGTLTRAERKFKTTEEAILRGDFQQKFHHSEPVVMSIMLAPESIDDVLDVLINENAASFGGGILDMHSTRYHCNNCVYQVIGFSNGGYMPTLLEGIADAGLRMTYPDTTPFLHARVSAQIPCTTNDGTEIDSSQDRARVHRYHPQEAGWLPLQTSVNKLRLTAYEGLQFRTYTDFFLSSDLQTDAVDNAVKLTRSRGNR